MTDPVLSAVSPEQVLVAEAQVSGREGGVGGAREILQEQEISNWLPGKIIKNGPAHHHCSSFKVIYYP